VKAPGGRHSARGLCLDLDQIVLTRQGGGADGNRVLGGFRNVRRASCRLGGRARRRTTANQSEDTDEGGNFQVASILDTRMRSLATLERRKHNQILTPQLPASDSHEEPLRPNVRSFLICGNTVTEYEQ